MLAGNPSVGPAAEPALHVFDRDTAIEEIAPNVYAAALSDRWSTVRGPNGGYFLSICLRALAAETRHPDPIVASAFFHSASASGPAEVRTQPVRSSRRLTTGEARLLQDDHEVLRLLASFADLEGTQGRTTELEAPPFLSVLDAAVDLDPDGLFPGSTLPTRFNYRVAELHGWRTGNPGGNASLEFAIDFAEPRPIDPIALALIVDACPRAVYELGEYSMLTLGLTMHVRARPAPGPLIGRVRTRHLRDGYHDEDLDLWDRESTLVAQSRQLALLTTPPPAAEPR